jgi:hypothetical protein
MSYGYRIGGKSEGVTWIVKAAGLRLFCFSIRRSENMEREGRPGNLDVQIVGKIIGAKS